MKIFKFMAIALVVMCGFVSCNECDHEFIEVDYSNALVGTWTLMNEGFAEAWVVKENGSVEVTGVLDGEYYETKGTVKVKNNKMSYKFDNGDQFEGILEIIPGKCFSLAYESDYQFEDRVTYNYCANDLADEVVGMWVSNNGPTDMENEIQIRTYEKDGIVTTTGVRTIDGNPEWMLNEECKYRVVGDLIFKKRSKEIDGQLKVTHSAERFVYAPKATALGDVMNVFFYLPMGDSYLESTVSFLRIKQSLDLPGNKYDYIKTYVSNVKGEDKDIPFLNTSFNFAKMDGSIIDKFLKSILFTVEFPDANTIKYSYLLEGQNIVMIAPIEVEGNKMTIKTSANNPVYHDVEVYTFQDQDNTQMHMYMHTTAFEKFFANTSVAVMLGYGQLDINDTDAIAGVYQTVADAVESINLSLVMTKTAK